MLPLLLVRCPPGYTLVSMQSALERDFSRVIAGHDHEVDLFGGAVVIARLGHDQIDAHALARELDLIAETVRERTGASASPETLADAISDELFVQRGFRGNREQYGDPRNSYIDQVIERRLGIPITLSLVYLEIAQRVGLECDGIGFPGHFLVRCGGDSGFFVDPFNGGEQPAREDLWQRLDDARTTNFPSTESLLAAVTRRQILQRMLANLSVAYQTLGDAPRWIATLGLRICLEPWNASLFLERGLIRYQQGENALALSDLEHYVEGQDQNLSPHALHLLERLRSESGRGGGADD